MHRLAAVVVSVGSIGERLDEADVKRPTSTAAAVALKRLGP